MSNVFIIVNEFYPDDESEYPCVEIVGGVCYGSYDLVHDEFSHLAAELNGYELPYGQDDFAPEENDRYYIQELIKHG